MLSLSLMLAVLWSLSLILFIFADYLCFPAFYSPLVLMITYAIFLLNPFQVNTDIIKTDSFLEEKNERLQNLELADGC